jgi:hypothetical protein
VVVARHVEASEFFLACLEEERLPSGVPTCLDVVRTSACPPASIKAQQQDFFVCTQ